MGTVGDDGGDVLLLFIQARVTLTLLVTARRFNFSWIASTARIRNVPAFRILFSLLYVWSAGMKL